MYSPMNSTEKAKSPARYLVPITVAAGVGAAIVIGATGQASPQLADAGTTAPSTTAPSATALPSTAESVGYTLDNAAQPGDQRVDNVGCLYLTDDDPTASLAYFRADRDQFFGIDSSEVRAARTDGLTFAEIAADYGFSETDVQDGAAAMHGYCYVQQVGAGMTQGMAERRFETTITRFLGLMDAEPDENGRGAGPQE